MPAAPHRPASPRDPALDGLRGVAILLVFLFHYGGGLRSPHLPVRLFGYLTQAGWVGVELFFALSGFLITGILWQNRTTPHLLRSFFARRALRILPVYYGALALAFIAAVLRGADPAHLRPLLIYAGFLQNIPPLVAAALSYPPPLPLHHLWSLAVEEQFYLLWPVLLLAARTRRQAVQLCLWTSGLCCAFRVAMFSLHPLGIAGWSPFLLTRAGALALGGVLALSGEKEQRWALPALLISLTVFGVLGYRGHSLILARPADFVLMLPAVEIACAAALSLALRPNLWRSLLSLRPLGGLGRISYGFYVLHILLEPLFDHLGRALTGSSAGSAYQTARLVTALPITVALAALSFRFFERPFLRKQQAFPEQHPRA